MTREQPTAALSNRFVRAVAFAIEAHGDQLRKGTEVTYVAHVLGVSSLVLEYGGDEDLAIAGLLHDTVEDASDGDGPATAERIAAEFGDRVASVVLDCSDTRVQPKPRWRERKEKYLVHLRSASPDVLLVSCCDKLHNARATVIDLREKGVGFWDEVGFNAGPAEQAWYYESLREIFTERFSELPRLVPLANEFSRAVAEISGYARDPQP